MFARILSGSLILAFVLVAIWLLGPTIITPGSGQQLAGEYRVASDAWGPATVYASRFITPEIASRLQLLDDGRRVEVVGHITCGEGQPFSVDVTVTQESTGATATGHTQGTCTGERRQIWTANATAHGQDTFDVGRALVCAEAFWPAVGTIEWCDRVRLEE